MIDRFGSLGSTLSARRRERAPFLKDAVQVEETLQHVTNAMRHVLSDRISGRPLLSNERAVLRYLRAVMAFEPLEQLRVLFLNAANELIADEVVAIGSVSAVHIYPREILRRCLELEATALLLAHNHPSGNPMPSAVDRDVTRRMMEAAKSLEIVFHDHIIIARSGVVSFRRAGFLR